MNLISCDGCGVVLDKHKMTFPTDIYDTHGGIDLTKAAYHEHDYHPFIKCPVCGEPVIESA